MKYDNRLMAGILLFVGSIQWFLVIVLSEGLAPGYNGSIQYVSDLGVGPTAVFYNASLVLFGVTMIVGGYGLYRALESRVLSFLLGAAGVGAPGDSQRNRSGGAAQTSCPHLEKVKPAQRFRHPK